MNKVYLSDFDFCDSWTSHRFMVSGLQWHLRPRLGSDCPCENGGAFLWHGRIQLLLYHLQGAESFLKSKQFLSLARNYHQFMETRCSLPLAQELHTCSYPKPDQSRPHLRTKILKARFNIIFPSTPRSSKWLFPLYAPFLSPCDTCTAQSTFLPKDQSKTKEALCCSVTLLSNYQTTRFQKTKR